MVLNTTNEYYEQWKLTTTNYQFFALVDLVKEHSYTYQGDEADPMLAKFDELGCEDFLDWWYNGGNDYLDHKNYLLTEDDIAYLVENVVNQ